MPTPRTLPERRDPGAGLGRAVQGRRDLADPVQYRGRARGQQVAAVAQAGGDPDRGQPEGAGRPHVGLGVADHGGRVPEAGLLDQVALGHPAVLGGPAGVGPLERAGDAEALDLVGERPGRAAQAEQDQPVAPGGQRRQDGVDPGKQPVKGEAGRGLDLGQEPGQELVQALGGDPAAGQDLGQGDAAPLQPPVGRGVQGAAAQRGQRRAVAPVVALADVDQGAVEVEEDGQRSSARRSSSRAARWRSISAAGASTGSKSTPRIQTIPSGAGLRRRGKAGGGSPKASFR
jgi:hypothetical protein